MKDWKKPARLLVGGVVVTGALAFAMDRLRDAPEPALTQWAIEARTSGEEIAFSRMQELMRESAPSDRAMVYPDMVVFEHAKTDSTEHLYSRATLNYNASELIWADSAAIAAEVSFGQLPQGMSSSTLVDVVLLLMFTYLVVSLGLRMSGISGKSNGTADLVKVKELTQTLDDVAGLDVAREQIREVVGLIKSGGKIGEIGARPPKGVLLQGPPGTGKTLLARAMAKEAGVSFLTLNAARLNEMFVGVGPKRVDRAFDKARRHAPCILFIDEIDALGARGGATIGADNERANLINALLTRMDGLAHSDGIFIVGATNRPDKIDKAIIRPGRIDRRLTIGMPNRKARQEILELHASKLPVSPDVDFAKLAASTPGMSGAELATLCNEAGILAGRDKVGRVGPLHFARAREKMMFGETGGAVVLGEHERQVTAWHEAGHAIAASVLPHTDPVEHATILPRGGSLGHVLQVAVDDRHMSTRAQLLDRMTVLAAGRAGEIAAFGEDMITNGAASDIKALTEIAQAMVTEWGMGSYGFLKVEARPDADFPSAVRQEIRDLSAAAMTRALELLSRERSAFTAIAEALLARDTLTGEEIRGLVEAHRAGRRQPMAVPA
ncbi:hypothetical protein OCH239_09720 [Roseivivax halodurans JCM 10272]|uniref:AAA+ ATPase domain-containing protein n=1 Tax=Roseivivax halodurans JCM 10272 TaxID=1449350 RepID=X7EC85_9RHOB|nr:AAA family ATPase [Roseivivax halodurans]ETX13547.1 hypothetical protein OCH239_09720 [Roseivivax halodurans JCM 10272]